MGFPGQTGGLVRGTPIARLASAGLMLLSNYASADELCVACAKPDAIYRFAVDQKLLSAYRATSGLCKRAPIKNTHRLRVRYRLFRCCPCPDNRGDRSLWTARAAWSG